MKSITEKTRPTTFDDVVGLQHIKDTVYYDIEGSKKQGVPYPSFIIAGPPGCSKSTVAGIIANLTGGEIHKVLGADLNKPEALYNLAIAAKDNDVIFIEEAHTIGGSSKNSKIVQAILLEWIENHQILGGADNGVLKVPKVCILLPTTNPGKLTFALRTRCRTLHTSYFSTADLTLIIKKACAKLEIPANDDEAIELLAQSSRGTPRIAIMNRLDRLQKIMIVDDIGFTMEAVQKLFKVDGINEYGLEHNDIKYCNLLYDKMIDNGGRPVSKQCLAQASGLSEDMLETVIEAYLQQIGAIQVTTRGRLLMPFGLEIIGRPPIAMSPTDILKERSVDLASVKEFIAKRGASTTTLKDVAEFLKLNPTRDAGLIKMCLSKIGYATRRRVGIKKISDTEEKI